MTARWPEDDRKLKTENHDLCQRLLDNLPAVDRRPFLTSFVKVGQFSGIESNLIENRGMNVEDINRPLDRSQPDGVGRSDDMASLHSAARHPGGESPWIMITPVAGLAER